MRGTLALLAMSTGCSFTFLPNSVENRPLRQAPTCHDEPKIPVADAVITAALVAASVFLVTRPLDPNAEDGVVIRDLHVAGYATGLLAIPYVLSSLYGLHEILRCREELEDYQIELKHPYVRGSGAAVRP